MATAADVRADIAAAQERLRLAQELRDQAYRDIQAAEERQALRRELDALNAQAGGVENEAYKAQEYRANVDQDIDGPSPPHEAEHGTRNGAKPEADAHAKEAAVSSRTNCNDAVVTGELDWKIEGMSWLVSTLQQNYDRCAESDPIRVGGYSFKLQYSPTRGNVHKRKEDDQLVKYKSSLSLLQTSYEKGVVFRSSFYIRRGNSDEFVPWGEEHEARHPHRDTFLWHFGPDVAVSTGLAPAAGIFGLSHAELLRSEWVRDDTLTVKVKLEVRLPTGYHRDGTVHESPIAVPPPSLAADFVSLLDHADESGDVTFVAGGERIGAHALVLSTRSEVFAQMFRSSMREVATREVVMDECDAITLRTLLQFLYSDDLERIDAHLQRQAAESGSASGDSSREGAPADPTARTSLLQRLLALAHRYQLARLRLWCEKKLAELVSAGTVCGCLCQAHLYEAKALEEMCLKFIKENHAKVSMTPSFGELSAAWPAVMVKLNHHLAGVQATEAAPAIEAALAQGTKRKRDEAAA